MEVNNSSGKIEKFSGKPGAISSKEFKATFSTMVYELEFKYSINYTKAFAFKQLARYVHYEALDVYEQHFTRILGVTQIPNPAYATDITTTSEAALQATITHHGTVPNNLDPVPTLIIFSPRQLIIATTNIPPTINAPAFINPVEESFQTFELKFSIKIFEKFYSLPPSLSRKMKPSRCSTKGFSSLKRILGASQTFKLPINIFVGWKVL
jgi:hypothetical protein